MNPTLTIAALTVKEAVRRRLLVAFLAITVAIVGLSAWGFDRLSHTNSITSGESQVALPQALILFMFMFSFVVALSASAIASPSISSEIESGRPHDGAHSPRPQDARCSSASGWDSPRCSPDMQASCAHSSSAWSTG